MIDCKTLSLPETVVCSRFGPPLVWSNLHAVGIKHWLGDCWPTKQTSKLKHIFMKTQLLIIALSILLPLPAFAAPANPEGTFASCTSTSSFAHSRASYEEEGGQFDGDEGEPSEPGEEMTICTVPVDDVATVSKIEGEFNISIATWGSNTHSCYYEGKAILDGDTLTSEEKIDDFDDGKPGLCKVTLEYLDDNTVTVDTDGDACRSFCGGRAWGLGIEKAVRTDPKDVKP
jgi:hypothetical protein